VLIDGGFSADLKAAFGISGSGETHQIEKMWI
jgi:hypothetical protein